MQICHIYPPESLGGCAFAPHPNWGLESAQKCLSLFTVKCYTEIMDICDNRFTHSHICKNNNNGNDNIL